MERYADTVEELSRWATASDEIRAVIIVGSQGREVFPADEWSDLDVVLFVRRPEALLNEHSWLERFGTVICSFTEGTAVGSWKERRVLYADNRDIDFAVLPAEDIRAAALEEVVISVVSRGLRIVVDKDDLAKYLDRPPSAVPARQTGVEEITNDINDFYYHVVWAQKKLERGELWTAVTCINTYLSRLLLRMLTWYCEAAQGTAADRWYNGRYLEQWAPKGTTGRLERCLCHYSDSDARETLLHLRAWYGEMAETVAAHAGFPSPERLDHDTAALVRSLRRTE